MNPDILRKHIAQTYLYLRYGLSGIGFTLPILLGVGGLLLGYELQNSLSRYYHTPLRNVHVGCMVAIGAFLFLYKGFSKKENIALDIAGIMAICTAIFPSGFPKPTTNEWIVSQMLNGTQVTRDIFTAGKAHDYCSIILFLAITYVTIWRSKDTLYLMTNPARAAKYRRTYNIIGNLMWILPLTVIILNYTKPTLVFWGELTSIWVFSSYWLVKSFEMKHLEATLLNSPSTTP